MENLRPKVRQLRRLMKAERFDGLCLWVKPRVRRADTVDVGPDLDPLGLQRCSYQGSGKIGAAPPQGRGQAFGIRGDEAAQHRSLSVLQQGKKPRPRAVGGGCSSGEAQVK